MLQFVLIEKTFFLFFIFKSCYTLSSKFVSSTNYFRDVSNFFDSFIGMQMFFGHQHFCVNNKLLIP